MSTQLSESSFKAMDPEISFIAASAALEVDDIMRGDTTELKNITRLSELLSNFTSGIKPEVGQSLRGMIDPISSDVLSRALFDAYHHTLDSYSELIVKTKELAEQLTKVDTSGGEAPLKELRDFCTALSKYTLTTRQSLYNTWDNNPYKK